MDGVCAQVGNIGDPCAPGPLQNDGCPTGLECPAGVCMVPGDVGDACAARVGDNDGCAELLSCVCDDADCVTPHCVPTEQAGAPPGGR